MQMMQVIAMLSVMPVPVRLYSIHSQPDHIVFTYLLFILCIVVSSVHVWPKNDVCRECVEVALVCRTGT